MISAHTHVLYTSSPHLIFIHGVVYTTTSVTDVFGLGVKFSRGLIFADFIERILHMFVLL